MSSDRSTLHRWTMLVCKPLNMEISLRLPWAYMNVDQGADRGLAFTSGMAALTAVVRLAEQGDHIVAGDDLYGGTSRLLSNVSKQGLCSSVLSVLLASVVVYVLIQNARQPPGLGEGRTTTQTGRRALTERDIVINVET